jgi:ABC-type lipoprotein export system ATPase subunit
VLGILRKSAGDGAAVLVATHNPEVTSACDRELRLRDGSLEQ